MKNAIRSFSIVPCFVLLILLPNACVQDFFSSNVPKCPSITKEEAVKYLKVEILSKSFDWDGKAEVLYTNTHDCYSFAMRKTGIKYKSFSGKRRYHHTATPMILKPLESKAIEISIPHGVTPLVAFALMDDVKVFQAKQQ